MSTQVDYGDDAAKPVTDSVMASIERLVREQLQAEADVAAANAALERAQDRLRDVSEHRLPEAMKEAGLEELKTPAGIKVALKETIHCSIAGEKKPPAFQWLRDNGFGGLIKRELKVPFGRGQDEAAEELRRELEAKYEGVSDKTDVNPQTLSAFARERLREGQALPDEFSIHRVSATKVTLPK